jgi:hypothetical protein
MHSKIGFSALAIAGLTFGAVGMTPLDGARQSGGVGSPAASDGGKRHSAGRDEPPIVVTVPSLPGDRPRLPRPTTHHHDK